MSQELDYEVLAERSGVPVKEILNTETSWVSQRQRRIAEFDWDLLRRSVELNGASDIALTFADYISVDNQQAQRYDQLTDETIRFIEEVERVSGIPVSLIPLGSMPAPSSTDAAGSHPRAAERAHVDP